MGASNSNMYSQYGPLYRPKRDGQMVVVTGAGENEANGIYVEMAGDGGILPLPSVCVAGLVVPPTARQPTLPMLLSLPNIHTILRLHACNPLMAPQPR